MRFLRGALKILFQWITLQAWRKRRSRERYDFLKSAISKRHFGGYAGLIVDDLPRKFGQKDRDCFQPPMYYWVKNQDMKWCVFWHRKRLSEEIGAGPPLLPGELDIKDTVGRTASIGTPNTINDKAPVPRDPESV